MPTVVSQYTANNVTDDEIGQCRGDSNVFTTRDTHGDETHALRLAFAPIIPGSLRISIEPPTDTKGRTPNPDDVLRYNTTIMDDGSGMLMGSIGAPPHGIIDYDTGMLMLMRRIGVSKDSRAVARYTYKVG